MSKYFYNYFAKSEFIVTLYGIKIFQNNKT